MVHKSGQCRTLKCPRAQQPGTGGYCARCFKVVTEKNNIQSRVVMEGLLVKVSQQLINIDERVQRLEGTTTQQQLPTQQESKKIIEKEDTFIPSIDTDAVADTKTIITPEIISNLSNNVNSAAKKLKLIQPDLLI